MERTIGPVDGYHVAIFARELAGTFRASYKVCILPPEDYRSACPLLHRRVDGKYHTLKEAFGIAEGLARLQISRLTKGKGLAAAEEYAATVPAELHGSADDDNSSFDSSVLYAPTEPAPLYAATEPAPLYEGRRD